MQNEDLERNVIESCQEISKAYNVSFSEIVKIISGSEKEFKTTFHIRFSDSELEIIDQRCKEKGLSRSAYCALCIKKAFDDKLYENMDLVQIAKRCYDVDTRNNRIQISMKKLDVCAKKVIRFSIDRGIETAALIRYFALNVRL